MEDADKGRSETNVTYSNSLQWLRDTRRVEGELNWGKGNGNRQ